MNATDEKVVELSKGKIVLILLGACVLALGGAFMFFLDAETISRGPLRHPLIARGIGLAAIIMCALALIVGIRKLFDQKPGVVFNSAGMVDNSSAFAAGFIPWSDISGAQIFEIQRKKFLIIKLVNPDKYIERGNSLTRALNRKNYQTQGSPIGITSMTLKAKTEELLIIFHEYFQKYGNAAQS